MHENFLKKRVSRSFPISYRNTRNMMWILWTCGIFTWLKLHALDTPYDDNPTSEHSADFTFTNYHGVYVNWARAVQMDLKRLSSSQHARKKQFIQYPPPVNTVEEELKLQDGLDIRAIHEREELTYYKSKTFSPTSIRARATSRGRIIGSNVGKSLYTSNSHVFMQQIERKKFLEQVKLIGGTFWNPVKVKMAINLEFTSKSLDFEKSALCIPKGLHFNIINHNNASFDDIRIHSIWIDDTQFQTPTFKDQLLSSGDSMSMHVVFLPRYTGRTSATMEIRTSLGTVLYPLKGYGIPNKYHIDPFLTKIPTGARFDPGIRFYNPYNETIRIVEVYTTESFLDLQAPDGLHSTKMGRDRSVWEIDPYEEKEFMKVSFQSQDTGVFEGFIHIKTHKDNFVVPVEITVLSAGLHSTPSILDFGVLASEEEEKKIYLEIYNSGINAVSVTGVSIDQTDDKIGVVLHGSSVIQPQSQSVGILSVTYLALKSGKFSGMLSVQSNETTSDRRFLEIPYKATITYGAISYLRNQTMFLVASPKCFDGKMKFLMNLDNFSFTSPGDTSIHRIKFTNDFDIPLLLESIKVFSQEFSLVHYTPGEIAHTHEEWSEVVLSFTPQLNRYEIRHSTLEIQTNGTSHHIKLFVHSGRLQFSFSSPKFNHVPKCIDETTYAFIKKKHLPHHKYTLDFGTVAARDHPFRFFNLTNPNPVPLVIDSIDCFVPGMDYALEIMIPSLEVDSSVLKEAEEWYDIYPNFQTQILSYKATLARYFLDKRKGIPTSVKSNLFTIPPGHVAMFKLRLRIPDYQEEFITPGIVLQTQSEIFTLEIRYKSMKGELSLPNRYIRFSPTFPGKIEMKPIILRNTFQKEMRIESIKLNDRRGQVVITNPKIATNTTTQIGMLIISPAYSMDCQGYHKLADCLAPPLPGQILRKLTTHGELVSKDDLYTISDRNRRFISMEADRNNKIDIDLIIDTDLIRGVVIKAEAMLIPPTFFNGSNIVLPTTQSTTTREFYFDMENPSDATLVVSLTVPPKDRNVFQCQRLNVSETECLNKWRKKLESPIKLNERHAFYLPQVAFSAQVVKPRQQFQIGPFYFHPKMSANFSGTIYLRNNLTTLSPIPFIGRGGSGNLVIETKISESVYKIFPNTIFDIIELDQGNRLFPNIRKSIRLKNIGNLPVKIMYVGIDGKQCSSYGFFLRRCKEFSEPFELLPFMHKDLEVDLITDCKLSETRHNLTIPTSYSALQYPLLARIPVQLIEKCVERVSKTPYTWTTKTLLVIVVIILLITMKKDMKMIFLVYGKGKSISMFLANEKEKKEPSTKTLPPFIMKQLNIIDRSDSDSIIEDLKFESVERILKKRKEEKSKQHKMEIQSTTNKSVFFSRDASIEEEEVEILSVTNAKSNIEEEECSQEMPFSKSSLLELITPKIVEMNEEEEEEEFKEGMLESVEKYSSNIAKKEYLGIHTDIDTLTTARKETKNLLSESHDSISFQDLVSDIDKLVYAPSKESISLFSEEGSSLTTRNGFENADHGTIGGNTFYRSRPRVSAPPGFSPKNSPKSSDGNNFPDRWAEHASNFSSSFFGSTSVFGGSYLCPLKNDPNLSSPSFFSASDPFFSFTPSSSPSAVSTPAFGTVGSSTSNSLRDGLGKLSPMYAPGSLPGMGYCSPGDSRMSHINPPPPPGLVLDASFPRTMTTNSSDPFIFGPIPPCEEMKGQNNSTCTQKENQMFN